ncbi:MAG: cohesin domain-containing protein [Candidatus Paceibacterota bacterium]
MSALAASISLSPTTVSVHAGDTFNVSVTADPASIKLYSVRANVSFDPSLVQVTNFSFASTWISISQPGYDSIDNANGTLVKAAGYPGGFTSATKLGTITFKAIKTGTAAITSTNSSLLLDSVSKNQISGTQGGVSVSIASAPTTPVKTTPKPTTVSSTKTKTPVVTSVVEPIAEEISTTSTTIATSSLLAAVNGAITFGTGSPIVSALFSAVVVLLVIYGLYYYRYYRRVG